MANSFVNTKALKLFLAKLIDAAPYIRASKGHFKGDLKGKKPGKSYNLYLTDAGNPSDGLKIDREKDDFSVQEREVTIYIKNKKTVVSLDVLEQVVDLESWNDEVAEPYGVRLGAEIQKDVIGNTFFQASTAFVGTSGWDAMATANAHLRSIRQGAKLVSFMDPMAATGLTVNALNNWNFGPSNKGQDFYGDNSIGKFSGSEYVECTDIPMVKGVTRELTIASAAKSTDQDNVGGIELTLSAGLSSAIKAGEPLYLTGAKACNVVGMPTNAPFVCFVQKDAAANATKIEVGRIELADIGSRNCYLEGAKELSDLADVTLTNVLTNGKTYFAVQTRTEDVLDFTQVELADLEGGKSKNANVGGIGMKWSTLGDFDNMVNESRADVCYGTGIVDNRLVAIAFIEA